VSVHGLPDQVIDVDVPGATTYDVGAEIGLRFPEPAGVLVQCP
jgi:2-aminoethylphosphonate transport system ATP-binding protein